MRPVPFFSVPGHPTQDRRRLILIAYHFPPSEEVGALRWQQLVHPVVQRGWGVDVITLDPSDLPRTDLELLDDLPPGLRLFGIPKRQLLVDRTEHVAWRGFRALRRPAARPSEPATFTYSPDSYPRSEVVESRVRGVRDLLRVFWAWRDHAVPGQWAREAARLALRLVEPGVHQAVITSGPPHMIHDAGRRVARSSGLAFVMDMRDAWSLAARVPEGVASPFWFALARRHERRAVEHASLVVVNTDVFQRTMREAYPRIAERIVTVTNGYDDDPVPAAHPNARFSIRFAGTLYLGRDPRPLFRAAARVIDELDLQPADIDLSLLGEVDHYCGVPTAEVARREGLEQYVHLRCRSTRRAAWQFMAGAAVLVSLPWHNALSIPAKLFEYMRFPAWLLVFAEPGSAPALLLHDTEARVVAPTDPDAAADFIRKCYLQYRQGIRATPLAPNPRFSRQSQAMRLLGEIEKRTGRAQEVDDTRAGR